MLLQTLLLIILAVATVASVRTLIMPGIDTLALNFRLNSKDRGQVLGYTTSIPELVIVVSSAAAGVFDAGFWNIASSNIINWILFLGVLILYRQWKDLATPAFLDELIFGVFSVVLPLALFRLGVRTSVWLGLGLVAVFLVYRILDRRFNRRITTAGEEPAAAGRSTGTGVLMLVLGIGAVIAAGHWLGLAAETLIVTLDTPAWLVGWLLGLITSVPEMSGFYEIYRAHKRKGTLAATDDTQEALDALVSSNMSNLGLILPAGIFVLALVRFLTN